MLGGLGAPELILILVVVVLLFGAGRIADLGKGLGQGIKNFKQGLKEVADDTDGKDSKPETSDKTKKKEEAVEKA